MRYVYKPNSGDGRYLGIHGLSHHVYGLFNEGPYHVPDPAHSSSDGRQTHR